MEYKLGKITKGWVSIESIVPQNPSIIHDYIIMSMEHIFQDINKQIMETTYTLKLGQLLKIKPNLKNYMWQKLKPKKPNIATQVIPESNVAIVVETHSELDTLVI